MKEMNVSAMYPELVPKKIPAEAQIKLAILTVKVLQPICNATNWHGLITSGYRSKQLNEKVGGVSNSQHRTGEAVDIMYYKKDEQGAPEMIKSIDVIKEIIKNKIEFDQAIIYNTFVHLSYTETNENRNQIIYNNNYKGQKL